jgi:molybdate/tungstate transport system ATP-binding protein
VHGGRVVGKPGAQRLHWPDADVAMPVETALPDGTAVDWHIAPESIEVHEVRPVDAEGVIAAALEVRQAGAHGSYMGLRCGQARLWAKSPSFALDVQTLWLRLPPTAIHCWPRA